MRRESLYLTDILEATDHEQGWVLGREAPDKSLAPGPWPPYGSLGVWPRSFPPDFAPPVYTSA